MRDFLEKNHEVINDIISTYSKYHQILILCDLDNYLFFDDSGEFCDKQIFNKYYSPPGFDSKTFSLLPPIKPYDYDFGKWLDGIYRGIKLQKITKNINEK